MRSFTQNKSLGIIVYPDGSQTEILYHDNLVQTGPNVRCGHCMLPVNLHIALKSLDQPRKLTMAPFGHPMRLEDL